MITKGWIKALISTVFTFVALAVAMLIAYLYDFLTGR